jgi:fused signal recognition particle receptor
MDSSWRRRRVQKPERRRDSSFLISNSSMGLFTKFKEGLQKTHSRLVHEIKRIVTLSPKLTGSTLEELEAALLGADLGTAVTSQIINEVRKAFETQGRSGLDIFEIAQREVERSLSSAAPHLLEQPRGLTVVSIVGVNGTGKTTTAAKLAHLIQSQKHSVVLGACDTFRAAAVEQLKLWGQRLNVPVIAGAYHADPAAVAHDAITAALARDAKYLLVDTAGRLHTKQNLMLELQKVHRVMEK